MAHDLYGRRGTQEPSKGLKPQNRNSTSFSKEYQPAIKTKKRAASFNKTKKTQAQVAMSIAGYNPMEQLIGLASKYSEMITDGTNWRGGKSSLKELESYIKEFTRINEIMARYFSSTAPIETSMEDPIEDSVTADAPVAISRDAPLTERDKMMARKDMKGRLEDKL